MKNIFDKDTANELIHRINSLSVSQERSWGTMDVAQMLAHCNVTYEMIYDNKHRKATGLKKFMLKLFVKPVVVNEKPYDKNSRTAPAFLIAEAKEFEQEKQRLLGFIIKTQQLGESHFEGKESNSFGTLNASEWNNLFFKHLDHHLKQFGA
ncbi:MAG: DUF1569 domain-containing protein [Flavobacteriales bacterium]|nr:DUF1569 domain-containing protein [Flavobacteriales bacterium]